MQFVAKLGANIKICVLHRGVDLLVDSTSCRTGRIHAMVVSLLAAVRLGLTERQAWVGFSIWGSTALEIYLCLKMWLLGHS